MEMTAVNQDGKMIVFLSGEIDHHSARDIRDGIDKLLVFERPKDLILDLKGIDFMDSSGLGLVLGRYRRANELGTKMYLCQVSDRIQKILTLSGVDKLVPTIKYERNENNND